MSRFDFRLEGDPRRGILLIHGLTGSPAEMRSIGKTLNRTGFTIFAPTLAGHCAGERVLLASRYEDWLDSVRRAIRRYAEEVDELYVARICVGGLLGLYAAHGEGERIKGAALLSPLVNYDGWNVPFYSRWSMRLVPLAVRLPILDRVNIADSAPHGIKSARVRRAVMGHEGAIDGTLPYFPVKALDQNLRLIRDFLSALPEIRVPTLLVHAIEDDVAHPRNALAIRARHGGRCEIAWLEDSYHLVHVDQERQKVADRVAEFFLGLG